MFTQGDTDASKVGTFRVFFERGQWVIRDYCGFNNWGRMSTTYDTREAAEAYALRCHEFKIGHRSTI